MIGNSTAGVRNVANNPRVSAKIYLFSLIKQSNGFFIKNGKPLGDCHNHNYICYDDGDGNIIPLALVLDNAETTRHAYVKIKED